MSTAALYATLRTRLLTFQRITGDSLVTILGTAASGAGVDGKLYKIQAPDNVTAPENAPSRWGVMTLKNWRRNAENPARAIVDLEVMLYARPRNQQDAMDEAADACDEAMFVYVANNDDLTGSWGGVRNTLPVMSEPADREVVQIRLAYTLVVYQGNLLQYHDTI